MAKCDNCGGHVTATYARVFSDNRGRLTSCQGCGSRDGRHAPDADG